MNQFMRGTQSISDKPGSQAPAHADTRRLLPETVTNDAGPSNLSGSGSGESFKGVIGIKIGDFN